MIDELPEDFHKWLCFLVGMEYKVSRVSVKGIDTNKFVDFYNKGFLFEAMCEINLSDSIPHSIIMLTMIFTVTFDNNPKKAFEKFKFEDYNNSPSKALLNALLYIHGEINK